MLSNFLGQFRRHPQAEFGLHLGHINSSMPEHDLDSIKAEMLTDPFRELKGAVDFGNSGGFAAKP